MTDYQIQASTRRCAATDREIGPGERYYSVLLDEGGSFLRKDFCEAAWSGPPAGAFSFWRTRLGDDRRPRRPPIDDEILVDCFHRLEGDLEPARLAFRHVLALLLLRRKKFRLDDTTREGMQVRCLRTGQRFTVVDPAMTDAELEAVQEDVFRVLGWE